jgi:hypothetical protein
MPVGVVAQLGERLNGIQEVDSSILFGSTILCLGVCAPAIELNSEHVIGAGNSGLDTRGRIGVARARPALRALLQLIHSECSPVSRSPHPAPKITSFFSSKQRDAYRRPAPQQWARRGFGPFGRFGVA